MLQVRRGLARNTELARRLLDTDTGIDPYLEDPGSLWRLHWMVTAHAGLGAWVTTFLELQDAQITRDRLIDVVRSRAVAARGSVTQRTATTHVDILLRTYDWARFEAATPGEDASGCPFQELHLIETSAVNGQTVVSVKRGPKPLLDVRAFAFALNDYWQGTAPGSRSLSVRSLLVDRRSPGVVYRLDEGSLLACLEELCGMSWYADAKRRSRRHGRSWRRAGEGTPRGGRVARELIAERIAIGRRYVRAVDILRDLEDPQALGRLCAHAFGSGRPSQGAGWPRERVLAASVPGDGAVRFGEVVLRFAAGAVVPGRDRRRVRRRTSPVTYSVGNRCRPIGRS